MGESCIKSHHRVPSFLAAFQATPSIENLFSLLQHAELTLTT
jgi:hypothetical protein